MDRIRTFATPQEVHHAAELLWIALHSPPKLATNKEQIQAAKLLASNGYKIPNAMMGGDRGQMGLGERLLFHDYLLRIMGDCLERLQAKLDFMRDVDGLDG